MYYHAFPRGKNIPKILRHHNIYMGISKIIYKSDSSKAVENAVSETYHEHNQKLSPHSHRKDSSGKHGGNYLGQYYTTEDIPAEMIIHLSVDKMQHEYSKI